MPYDENAEEILQDRRRMKVEYGALFDKVAALLFRYDPAKINFEVNSDEYETEAGTILPRLRTCQSVRDVQRAGPEETYREIASEIWLMWLDQRHREH